MHRYLIYTYVIIYTPNCLISSSTVGGYTDLQKVKWWTKHNDWPIASKWISPTVPVGFVGVACQHPYCFFSRRNGWLCHLGVLGATPSATQNSGINWFYSRFFHTPPKRWDYTGHKEWTKSSKMFIPIWFNQVSPDVDTWTANLRWVPSPPWWRHWNNGGRIQA